MKCFVRFICLLSFFFVNLGCASAPSPTPTPRASQELIIFAAASLTEALTSVGTAFAEKYPHSRPIFNFAGSQQLASQLAHGAQSDIFASADLRQMDEVIRSGRIDATEVVLFACNRLVVVTSGHAIDSLVGLSEPGVKIVIGADAVPVGAYTVDFLAAAAADPAYGEEFRQGVLANVVSYEQSVRAVLSKVRLGEADAGIVYATDARSVSDVAVLEIPVHLNQLANYQIAPLLDGSYQSGLAHDFISFLRSPDGNDLLSAAGFMLDCVSSGRRHTS